MTTASPTPVRRPGRLLLFAGLICALLGVAGYALQIALARLFLPWYLPAAATLGALLVATAFVQDRTLGRGLAFLFALFLCAAAWAFLLKTQVPAYTGPIVEGKPFPTFASRRADGEAFTHHDLRGGPHRVLVFFRGRW